MISKIDDGTAVARSIHGVSRQPAAAGDPDAPLKALIFDSIYDSYKGVIVYIRVFEGTVKPGDTIKLTIARIEGNQIKTFKVDCKLIESKGN